MKLPDVARSRAVLLDRVLAWLDREPDPAYADEVLRYLTETPTDDESWHVLWDRFRRAPWVPDREDHQQRLAELGSGWLAGHAADEVTADWPGIPIWLFVSHRQDNRWPHLPAGLAWLRAVVDRDRAGPYRVPPHEVWHRMWQHGSDDPELVDLGLRLLADPDLRRPSRAWRRTCESLAEHTPTAVAPHVIAYRRDDPQRAPDLAWAVGKLRDATDPGLVEHTVTWLEEVPEAGSPGWRETWRTAADWLDATPDGTAARLRAVASRAFEARALTHRGMGPFWLRAWEFGVDRDLLADALLAADPAQLRLDDLHVRIWRHARTHAPESPELDRIGHRWLASDTHVGPRWAEVFAELWRGTRDQLVLSRVLGLVRRTDLPPEEVRRAVRGLVDSARLGELTDLPDLRQLIRDELALLEPDENPLWPAVLAAVGVGDDEALHRVTLHWLTSAPPDPDRLEPFLELWRAAPSAELTAWAVGVLASTPTDDPRWFGTWQLLEDAGVERDRIAGTVDECLRADVPVACGTEKAWRAAWLAKPGDARVRRYVERWLTQHLDHSGWPELWAHAWEAAPGEAMLAAVARRWLDRNHANRAWPRIAGTVWRATRDGDVLAVLGQHVTGWQTYRDRPDDLAELWLVVLSEPTDALVTQATAWLRERQAKPVVWARVWQDCWDFAPSDRLAGLGLGWLRHIRPYPGSRLRCWASIWISLWDADKDHAALSALALQVPRSVSNHEIWFDVAKRLVKGGPPGGWPRPAPG